MNEEQNEELELNRLMQVRKDKLPWDFPDKSTGVGCHCLSERPSNHF